MSASVKIIHNKKISMTPQEWEAYTNICRAYDRPNFNGSDLFIDLFDTDKNGNITFIRPPSRQTSMEVFLFVCALYEHQGRRLLEAMEEERLNELSAKFEKRLTELASLYEKKIEEVENR